MDPKSEPAETISPARENVLTLSAMFVAILALTAFFWFLLSPLLDILDMSLLTFVMQPFGLVLLAIWLTGAAALCIGVSQYTELYFHPITAEEGNDPLVREIDLRCSLKEAWDLCYESPYAAGRWWYVRPSTCEPLLSAYWTGLSFCHITIRLGQRTDTRYHVVVSAREIYRWYQKTGSATSWERSPEYATAKDLSRRRSIEKLDAIAAFLREHGR